MVAHTAEPIKLTLPTDREAYRAWLRTLSEAGRLLLFGVTPDANLFRCPTNGRQYVSTAPPVVHDDPASPYISTRCYWCDAMGRVRGEAGFDRDAPESHSYPIVERGAAR